MREIKFRAWDTRRNKMWSAEEMGQDQLTLMPDGRGFINVSGKSTKLSTFMNHLIPMQFTGLKDKNGKEIYEGDICKWTDSDGVIRIDEVQFAFAKFFLCNSSHSIYEYVGKELVVIGNVHQKEKE